MDRLGLPSERVKPVMVEIGRGEVGIPIRGEPPRPIVEALPRDVDVVAVEHAMDEPGGEIARGEPRRCLRDEIEQSKRVRLVVVAWCFRIEVLEAVAYQLLEIVDLPEEGEPLERADANVSVAEAGQHRRAGGGGLVAALQCFPRFEQGEAL